jgi:hypothetical protein
MLPVSCGSFSDLQFELLGIAKRWLRAQLTLLDAARVPDRRHAVVVAAERYCRACSCTVQHDCNLHIGGLAQPRKIFESLVHSCTLAL